MNKEWVKFYGFCVLWLAILIGWAEWSLSYFGTHQGSPTGLGAGLIMAGGFVILMKGWAGDPVNPNPRENNE